MLDWWQWVLFHRDTLKLYGVDAKHRRYFVGLRQHYSYHAACTIGLWGVSTPQAVADALGFPNHPKAAHEFAEDHGVTPTWEVLYRRVDPAVRSDYPLDPTYPHLTLMSMIYEAELERMKTDPRSVPLAASEEDTTLRKRTRYGVLPVEVVRYFQMQVQILREFRISFATWRSWNEEQQQTAWVHGNYSLQLPERAHEWVSKNPDSRGRTTGSPLPPVDHTKRRAPPSEVALADLRGSLPVTARYGKAPRSLLE